MYSEDGIENLFNIAENIFDKVSEDLQYPDDLEILTTWGDILEGVSSQGHINVVAESVIVIKQTIDNLLRNFGQIKESLYKIHESTNEEQIQFLEPLSKVIMGIFIGCFSSIIIKEELNMSEKEAVQLLDALCINHIIALISGNVKRQTGGVLDEKVKVNLPNMHRLHDKDGAIKYICDVASGKTQANINMGNISQIFNSNNDEVVGFIQTRINELEKKSHKDSYDRALNKVLIRTYKIMLYNFENSDEEKSMFRYPLLVVLSDTMSYLLKQFNSIDDYRIKELADNYVREEYITCRKFVLSTWSLYVLKYFTIMLNSHQDNHEREQNGKNS